MYRGTKKTIFYHIKKDQDLNSATQLQFVFLKPLLYDNFYMGIVVRQSIKSAIITLGGALLGAVIALLSVRFFPQQEYGFRENLIKISIWVSYFSLFGYNYTLLIWGQRYPIGHPSRSTFLAICFSIPIIFSMAVTLLYFCFAPYINTWYKPEDALMMQQYFYLFPLLTFLSTIITLFEGYLQSINKTAIQAFAREILARIIYIVLIALYIGTYINFKSFIILYVITYCIPLAYLYYFATKYKGFSLHYKSNTFNKKVIKEMFAFSGYHMLTVASTVLILIVDAIIMGPLLGLEAVAIYTFATLMVSMLRNPTRVIGVAATPTFTQHYNDGAIATLQQLFARAAVNMQIIAVGLVGLVLLNTFNVQTFINIIKPGYEAVSYLMAVLMIGQFVDMFTGLNTELIGVSKHYRFNFWIAIILLIVVILLNFYLIQKIGISGAAWASAISLFLFNACKTWFLWKKMHIHPFSKNSMLVLLWGGIAFLMAWILPQLPYFWLDAIMRSGLFSIILWFTLYKSKISSDINTLTDNLIKHKRLY
jgi:O-antigen/teichoic acid export membrane protein